MLSLAVTLYEESPWDAFMFGCELPGMFYEAIAPDAIENWLGENQRNQYRRQIIANLEVLK